MDRASCPSCGAPIVFETRGTLAVVCAQCRSVVRNTGIDLERFGKLSAVREDDTPFAIGTTGVYERRPFTLVGRLQIRHLDGTWNEWAVAFDDGQQAWLAEAMGFLSITARVDDSAPRGGLENYSPGDKISFTSGQFVVKEAAAARVLGGEGSLPFAASDGWALPFVDLASTDGGAATIDFSDGAPVVYMGRYVPFDAFNFRGLREDLPPEHPAARVGKALIETVRCPSCGGSLERCTGAQSSTLTCGYCGAQIDLTVEPYRVFANQDWTGSLPGTLKLGQVGNWEVTPYSGTEPNGPKVPKLAQFRVLAMLERWIPKWDVTWVEYLLHNRKHGYRWLIEMNGHFTWVEMLPEVAAERYGAVVARGVTAKPREADSVVVRRVVGELYWRVSAGEMVDTADYTSAPWMISSEGTAGERTWSMGQWVEPARVQRAFGIDTMPKVVGKMPHQPPPQDKVLKPIAKRWGIAVALLIPLAIAYVGTRKSVPVATDEIAVDLPADAATRMNLQRGTEDPAADAWLDSHIKWYGPFEITNGPVAVDVEVRTDLINGWMLAHGSLYDETSGTATDFVEEVSYYTDSDGSYGSQSATVTLPQVPSGTYWFRFEPVPGETTDTTINVKLRVVVDAPLAVWFGLAFLALTLPLLWLLFRRLIFTSVRDKVEE
jgi:hypothetical protein